MTLTNAVFPLVPGGKTPIPDGWQHTQPGTYSPIGNYGIVLREDDLIADADPRNYPPGRDVLSELMEAYPLPYTRLVKTPRGGYHVYLKKPADLKFRKKQTRFPGIDFLTAGQYVVGPGSMTIADAARDTVDGIYELIIDTPAAQAPTELLAVLERYSDAIKQGTEKPTLIMSAQFKTECQIADPPISGNRDNAAYQLACRGRDLGLPSDVIFEILRDQWMPRASEPLSDNELYDKVRHAFRYAKNAAGSATPEAKFTPDMAAPNAAPISISDYQQGKSEQVLQTDQLELDNKGVPKKSIGNVACVLRFDPAWRGQIRFNEFSKALEFKQRPSWRAKQMNEGLEVDKRDFSALRVWFSAAQHVRWDVPKDVLKDAIYTAATPYHPVREYLDGLVWDGVARLDRILIDTAGADDNEYVRAVGKCMMIAACKRIYEPGCKHDYVLILEGPQGMRKSMWIGALGGQWYSSNELNRGDKDSYQNLRGRWFVELPEINATFSKADFNWLKGVVSNAVDVYRASFGEIAKGVPRESVFIGSINPSSSGEYLKDEENRRYWPVTTRRFEIEALEKNRDQYFAEAVHRYRQGEDTWLTDGAVKRSAEREQEKRREKEPWTEILAPWLAAQVDGFAPSDVYHYLGFTGSQVSSHYRSRLYSVLKQLGYEHKPELGTGGKWVKRPPTLEELL